MSTGQDRKDMALTHPVKAAFLLAVAWGGGMFFLLVVSALVSGGQMPGLLVAIVLVPASAFFGIAFVAVIRRRDRRARGVTKPSQRELRRDRARREGVSGW
jgi:membrane protein implicated in regulation of membrane protease activity